MTTANIRSRRNAPPPSTEPASAPQLATADLVLIRVASAGATRAELQRDLLPIASASKTAGTAFRQAAEMAIGAHVSQSWLTDIRGRLQITDVGRAAAVRLLPGLATAESWDDARVAMLARTLGLSKPSPQAQKAFARVEGLAALVLQRHFEIGGERVLSPTDLRASLAIIALERAFGNKIKTGLGKGAGLPGKAGRVLAAQLFSSPREFSSDAKLIVALAADVTSASDATLEALTIAVLRRLTARDASSAIEPKRRPSPAPDNDALPISTTMPPHLRSIELPGMAEFAGAVADAARPVSQGWPGNRKAFISLVWRAIRDARPDWGLSEVAFKRMLAEAHRAGAVVLASADLKDRCDLGELEDSKILYKNTVWHFVRVED